MDNARIGRLIIVAFMVSIGASKIYYGIGTVHSYANLNKSQSQPVSAFCEEMTASFGTRTSNGSDGPSASLTVADKCSRIMTQWTKLQSDLSPLRLVSGVLGATLGIFSLVVAISMQKRMAYALHLARYALAWQIAHSIVTVAYVSLCSISCTRHYTDVFPQMAQSGFLIVLLNAEYLITAFFSLLTCVGYWLSVVGARRLIHGTAVPSTEK